MIPKDFKGYLANNRFHIAESIGQGPHGEVYRVEEQANRQNKGFAAKFFKFPLKGEQPDIEAYRQAVNGLDQDTVLSIEEIDRKKVKGNQYYCLIMEYVSGGSLTKVLSLSPAGLPHEPVLGKKLKDILIELCRTLAVIHESGSDIAVHGNLKPENIFFDIDGRIFLSDFQRDGLHMNYPPGNGSHPPYYASPQQLGDANHKDLGPWTDIWSFGILMFQLMTAEYPFSGSSFDEKKLNITASMDNIKKTECFPQSLSRILNKCLSKDPVKRYGSAKALLVDLLEAPFTKKCTNGHENEYFVGECAHKGCQAGFVEYSDNALVPHATPWVRHTSLPIVLSPGEEQIFQVELRPCNHPDYNRFSSSGKSTIIRFVSPDDENLIQKEITVALQPPPRFEVEPSVFPISFSPSINSETIQFRLGLSRGEAVIETAELLMDNEKAIHFTWDTDGREVKGNRPVEMRAELNLAETEPDSEHPLTLIVKLKNRPQPVRLDSSYFARSFCLRVIRVPQPQLVDNEAPVQVFRGLGPIRKRLQITNEGGREFVIGNVIPRVPSHMGPPRDRSGIIDFNLPDYQIKVPVEAYRYVDYSINPDQISENTLLVEVLLQYSYHHDNELVTREITQQVSFNISDLQTCMLLAVDFGTTSTCAMGLVDISGHDNQTRNLAPAEGESIIPSAIRYLPDREGVLVGRKAEAAYHSGESNAFRSFKRFLGDPSKLYDLYFHKRQYKTYRADRLIADYISEILKMIKNKWGYVFENYVFTHPNKFNLYQHAALRKIIGNCGIDLDHCYFIDEATAGALPYISLNEGKYRLAVYDFGGGTIDITYLDVVNIPNEIKIEVLDTGGLPQFGGDDVTNTIMELYLEKIKDYLDENAQTLLLPNPQKKAGRYKKESRSNEQLILTACEIYKTEIIFGEDINKNISYTNRTINDRNNSGMHFLKLYVVNEKGDRVRKIEVDTKVVITPREVYRNIYEKIDESVEIIRQMVVRDSSREEEGLELHVLLTGGSSKIPLVYDTFQGYRKGLRSSIDAETGNVEFKEDHQRSSKLSFDKLTMADSLEDLNTNDPMKECVALGSIMFGHSAIVPENEFTLDIHALLDKTWSRIGMVTAKTIHIPGSSKGLVFNEWIPRNKKLVPLSGLPIKLNEQDYAVEERDYIFNFDEEKGHLTYPITIFEHHAGDNEADPARCSALGQWSLKRPEILSNRKVKGRLKIELLENLQLRLTASINERKMEAYALENRF